MNNKILFSVVLLIFSVFTVQAQIAEETRALNHSSNNAMVLEVKDADEKFVNKIWKNFLEDYYDAKTKWMRKEHYWLSDNAEIAGLGGSNTVDIYGLAEQKGKHVEMLVWVDLGGAYLSSTTHPDRYEEGERMMNRFAIEIEKEKTKITLKEEEKELKSIQSELKKLVAANQRYHKDIERAKEAIKKAEADIEQNIKAQEATSIKIESQEKVIQTVQKKLTGL